MSHSYSASNSRFHFADLYPEKTGNLSRRVKGAVRAELARARGKAARKRARLIAQLAKEQAHDQANY